MFVHAFHVCLICNKAKCHAKPRSKTHVEKSSPHLGGRSCKLTLPRGMILGQEKNLWPFLQAVDIGWRRSSICFSPKGSHLVFGQNPLAGPNHVAPYWGWRPRRMESKACCAITCYTVSNDIYNWLLYSTKIHLGLWESDSETPRVSVFRLSEVGDESFNDKVLREGRELYEVVCGFRSKIMVEFTSLLSKFCKIFYCLCRIIYLPLLPYWIRFLSVGPMTSLLSHSR